MFKKFELKNWETTLILTAIIIFIISLLLYFLDMGFISRLVGLDDTRKNQVVGILAAQSPEVKRQLEGESSFKDIKSNAQL